MLNIDNKDQQHPQEKIDNEIAERLLQQAANDYNLAELARLRIRYTGFPGAREIQQNLDAVLQHWRLTEEQLFELTRQIHARGQVYKKDNSSERQDDWN
ncbi:MAG TPA: DUF3288 domain-containing protein [Cyanobacteria bacterium UBA11162]|nr:DUF3288 domain-containing protein [Cyanobacteria bacterium UBA12227]HAX87026.1 DUF3288 domain-containing protein [Cyanobacteria bacterium UBA11370]HBL12923.1 DUF3288 domain-containing protein [Cyanobacteria bacterium UBA11162]HBY80640.1 DUF3288 domain-containing protein [Cyanobacteria bacterium UBA11148]